MNRDREAQARETLNALRHLAWPEDGNGEAGSPPTVAGFKWDATLDARRTPSESVFRLTFSDGTTLTAKLGDVTVGGSA